MEPLEDEQLAGQVLTLTAAATPRTEFREIKANAIRVKELDSMWGVDISTVLGPDVIFQATTAALQFRTSLGFFRDITRDHPPHLRQQYNHEKACNFVHAGNGDSCDRCMQQERSGDGNNLT